MSNDAKDPGRVLTDRIAAAFAPLGMMPFGVFRIDAGDIQAAHHHKLIGSHAVLMGNAGGAMWDVFSASPEITDSDGNPLDRWTKRVVEERIRAFGNEGQKPFALYPFGAAVWPFQRWAKRAMGVDASPLGLLIHPRYGLWFALRAALVIGEGDLEKLIQDDEKVIHPCDYCMRKPCLSACPVNAFTETGFVVERCRSYLDSTSSQVESDKPDCMGDGCAARNACPVGQQWRYDEPQIRFHMAAFRV